jgi:hypothetical protein
VVTPAQLDLFAALHPPPVLEPVDPDGPVVAGAPDITLRLPHPRYAWDLARIQLHEHEDGRWMWSASTTGGGYKVGPKWGRFAATQADAMRHAAREVIERCARIRDPSSVSITDTQLRQIRAWAEGLL